jgi:small conductance mechanosensitive channel
MRANVLQAALVFGGFYLLSIVVDRILKKAQERYHSSTSESFRLMSSSQKAILIFIGLSLAL